MLSTLRVLNLAVVDELEVEFGPGLNVMTGETGSGKSVILRAIELLSGRRATADLVRHGAERCTVEGVFHHGGMATLREKIAEHDQSLADSLEGEEIIIRRVTEKTGRGKIYVNGAITSAGSLQALGEHLIDITGQHQQQTLLDPARHLELLDMFGVPVKLREQMSSRARSFFEARDRYDRFSKDSAQQEAEIARFEEELAELDAAGLSNGGRAALEAELHRFTHVELLSAGIQRALALIEEDDQSLDSYFRELLGVVEKCVTVDPTFTQSMQLLESASAQVSEAGMQLSQIGSRLEMNPQRLEELREQIAEIARLERKYARKEAPLIDYRESVREKLQKLGGGELSLEKLKADADEAQKEAEKVSVELTKVRKRLAQELSQVIAKELGRLNMKRAQFVVSLLPRELSLTGAETIEFLFSANPGEPARALQKVASGGELSRVLLVLKTLLNERNLPGTQVFDEIDSGVSGAVSQVVGEKLLAVASSSQVILVTHSPQIASLADQHFLIEKVSIKDSTRTSIRSLSREERVSHIASMLAGKQVSTHFEKSAEELLSARITPV